MQSLACHVWNAHYHCTSTSVVITRGAYHSRTIHQAPSCVRSMPGQTERIQSPISYWARCDSVRNLAFGFGFVFMNPGLFLSVLSLQIRKGEYVSLHTPPSLCEAFPPKFVSEKGLAAAKLPGSKQTKWQPQEANRPSGNHKKQTDQVATTKTFLLHLPLGFKP